MRRLVRALIGLAVAGLAAGLGALALVLSTDREPESAPFIVLGLSMGWSFIGAGLYAWWRRPGNRTGALMTLVGFAWFVGALEYAEGPAAYTFGLAVSAVWIAALVHMLVAFPSGRVTGRLDRAVVGVGWVAMGVLPPLYLLVTEQPDTGCDECPENLLAVLASDTAPDVIEVVTAGLIVALLPGLAVAMVRHWRAAGAVQRRALAPVAWTGAAVAGIGLLSIVPEVAGADRLSEAADFAFITAITLVPLAFVVGVMRAGLSRAGVVDALFDRLGRAGARDALAEALGDDSLTLAYWRPDARRYIDADGHTVALPDPGAGRGVTEIARDGAPVAAIVHDPVLLEDRELVRTAGAAAALALQNEQLHAEVRARFEDLQAASARLVAAGDAARRRLERDLHDGAQQRLVTLALTLRLARQAAEPGSRTAALLDSAAEELSAGMAELRELARGIHPAVLTERGLDPALAGLVARAPLPVTLAATLPGRLPLAVEVAAYFVVMEALTNVAKYASASRAAVTVEQADGEVVVRVQDDGVGGADPEAGSGLAGLADRVAALGGRLVVESPRGGGTLVRAELPAEPRSAPAPVR